MYTVSQKTSPVFLAITRESIVGFSQYLAEILLRKEAIKRCYIFPPHLINASAVLHYLVRLLDYFSFIKR